MTTPRFVAERTPGGTPSSPRWSADRAADGAAYAQGARAGHWTSNSAPSTTSDGPAWRAVPYLEVRSGRRSRSYYERRRFVLSVFPRPPLSGTSTTISGQQGYPDHDRGQPRR